MIPNNKTSKIERSNIMLCLIFGLVSLLFFSTNSFAHKVNMFAFGEGDQIFVEGYFADGKKAKNSKVVVFDGEGKEIVQGITTDDGQYTFKYPKGTDLLITLDAGMGHKTEYTITEAELSDEEFSDEDVQENEAEIGSSTELHVNSAVVKSVENASSTVNFSLSEKQIRTEVERAVGKAIKPLMRELSEMREAKSLSEIIGGIGFIFGLLGGFMYYKARKMEGK